MKIRHLLAVAAASATVASASAFEWSPAVQQPNPSLEVTQAYQLETMRFMADYGLATTDVMPKWIDEDGNEIVGTVSAFCDPNWGEYIYDFNIADFKGNGEYTLQFPEGMLKNNDGELSDPKEFYYTVDVDALSGGMFEDFQVLSITPDLSEAQALWNDQVVTINTNHNDAIAYTELNIFDKTTGEGVVFSNNFTTGRSLGNASPISWEVANAYKFYEGHTYSANFIFYNGSNVTDNEGNPTPIVAKYTVEFTGRVEGYKYSDVTLLGINPAPYTMTISEPSQAIFTYTFSGPVNVYKAETPMGQFGTTVYPESCLSSNEDKTVWTLNLSDNEYVNSVDAELVIYLYARDLDGSQVKGDFGEDDNSCIVAGWVCDLGAKSIVVVSPASGETLDQLTEVVVKSVDGEAMTYNWGDMTIQNLLGETIGTLVYDGDGGSQTEFHFTKWMVGDSWTAEPINIVAEGSYVLNFSTGCFVFGEQFSSKNSRSLYSGFQITGALEEKPDDPVDPAEQEVFEYTLVNPESGSVVESLDKIQLWFPDEVACEEFEVSVYNADQTLVTTGTGLYDWDDIYLIEVNLAEPITADGQYTVVIPGRVIGTPAFLESDGKGGICNPEITLNYTIGAVAADPQEAFNYVSANPEVGSTVESLDLILLSFAEPAICDDFEVNVYSAARTLVATGLGTYDIGDPTRVVVRFAEPITETGMYDVVIPSRVIVNPAFYESNGEAGLCNPEFHLHYTVDGAEQPGVDPAEQEVFNYTSVDPADNSTVNELSKISLTFPDVVMTWATVAYVYKADATDAAPVTEALIDWDWMDEYLINVTLNTPVKEDGDYVVVIPARSICDDPFYMSEGKSGTCNPEIRLNYTVNVGSGVDAIIGTSTVNVFDVQGRVVLKNASASDVKKLAKGIYVVNGKKFVVK